MKIKVNKIAIPNTSQIHAQLERAYFYDSYQMTMQTEGKTALELYLKIAATNPNWITQLMKLRNYIVGFFGLKNQGLLGDFDTKRPVQSYRVGDRVGIFTLLKISDQEVIMGETDRHLNVKLSLLKMSQHSNLPPQTSVAISTVVHVHNTLGRLYMLLVKPMHQIIVPASLRHSLKENI
jgi:hypothetical protein